MPLQPEKPSDEALPVVQTVEPLATMQDVQPLDMQALFEKAMAMGPDGAAALERLVDLKCKMDDRYAAEVFAKAKAQFQRDCPPLIRLHQNTGYTRVNRAGVTVPSMYTSLEDMETIVRPPLEKNGFSYGWGDMEEDVEKQQLSMPFILTHIGGHQTKNRATLPTTPGAGAEKKKTTAQQSRFSVVTYLQRLSMRLGLGLGGGEFDDDGAGGSEPAERISAEQAKGLHTFMLDVRANWAQFKAHFGIENIAELPVSRYDEAMRELNKKLKKQESQNE